MAKKKVALQRKAVWWLRAWHRIIFLCLLMAFFIWYPGQSVYTVYRDVEKPAILDLPFVIPTPAPYPSVRNGIIPEDITASGIVILDVHSGVYLYKRAEHERLSPASTTKILTALVALDRYSLDEVVTVRTVLTDGQRMGLLPNEQITVENLLYGVLVHSGNDAAYALSENYPGGVPAFVAAMNEKARSLHLNESTFTNSVGYDDPGHKMTAIDLSRLAAAALRNKTIAKMVAIPQITVSDVTHTHFHSLKNVNELLGKIPGVGGIKTGWTEEAGENLVTLVERDGRSVILVLLHSQDRFGETSRLIDWVFSNVRWTSYDFENPADPQ
ncbi:MAG: D-alanyl-D-alanine carboxypeptidase family protein [bacterium]|nr:D-alanyl-D-alanine carboxypeptidase family protein [bacterium]